MIQALVLADDVTGALDTAVKFSAVGLNTKVSLSAELASQKLEGDVLVLCVPTRHLSGEEAYKTVRKVAEQASEYKIQYILKKTDSGLRGNVGAELSAVLDGSGAQCLTFIPALPNMNRTTQKGIHYINGIPVHESVFGKDPFEPVKTSYVPELLISQCSEGTKILTCTIPPVQVSGDKTIIVLDCTSQEEMQSHVSTILSDGNPKVLAGCSGLAEALAQKMSHGGSQRSLKAENRLTVVCGSVNPISRGQMSYAGEKGFEWFHLPAEELLQKGGISSEAGQEILASLLEKHGSCNRLLIDTVSNEALSEGENLRERRSQVAQLLGEFLKILLQRSGDFCLMIIGGDTLLGFMNAIECQELIPVKELLPGVVASYFTYQDKEHVVISKSGGFGSEDLLLNLPMVEA